MGMRKEQDKNKHLEFDLNKRGDEESDNAKLFI